MKWTKPPPAKSRWVCKKTALLKGWASTEADSRVLGNLEIADLLFNILVGEVLHDDLVGNVTGRGGEISPDPYMATPELSGEIFEFREEFVGSFSFKGLHELWDREIGWSGDEEMHMILRSGTFDDLHILCFAYLSDEFPETFGNLSVDDLFAVFGNPYHVIFKVIGWMGSLSIVLHSVMLQSLRLKVRVFLPEGDNNKYTFFFIIYK
jgi:hypothetical protein